MDKYYEGGDRDTDISSDWKRGFIVIINLGVSSGEVLLFQNVLCWKVVGASVMEVHPLHSNFYCMLFSCPPLPGGVAEYISTGRVYWGLTEAI